MGLRGEGGKVGPDAHAIGVGARGLGVSASGGEGTAMVIDHGSALCKHCRLPCSSLPPFLFCNFLSLSRIAEYIRTWFVGQTQKFFVLGQHFVIGPV